MNDKKYRNNVGLWKIGHFVQNYKILAKVVNPNLLAIVICFLAIFYISSLNFAFGQDNVSNKEGFVEIGKLLQPRIRPSAVVLNDGRIFIVGGDDENNHSLNTTEIFDPKTGKSVYGPNLANKDITFSPFLYNLNNGKVLIVSSPSVGYLSKIQIFNPKKNIIESTFNFEEEYARFSKETSYALQLNNNEVLVFSRIGFSHGFNYKIKQNSISPINKNIINTFEHYSKSVPIFIDKYNNYFYFFGASFDIYKIQADNLKNGYCIKINEKAYDGFKSAILIKSKNIIAMLNSKSLYLFDIQKEKFEKILNFGENHYKKPFRRLFEKSNGNILIFEYAANTFYDRVYEFDIEKKEIISKNYHTPTRFSDIVQSDKGDIYSIGGERINEVFMHHSLSNKVYLLKQ